MDLSDQIKENMKRLSDEALAKIIEVDSRDYSEEALAIAKEELAQRRAAAPGIAPGQMAGMPAADVDATAGLAVARRAPGMTRSSRFWGGVFLVIAAVVAYTAVLMGSTAIVASQHNMRLKSEVGPMLFFYAAIVGLCLWGGIRRTKRWERFLGIAFLIIGTLVLIARINITRFQPSEEIVKSSVMITGVALLVLGVTFSLLDLAKRRSAK